MNKLNQIIGLAVLISALGAQAQEVRKDAEEPNVSQSLQNLRSKQELEEQKGAIRVIPTLPTNMRPQCTPIQQTRQRLRDLQMTDPKKANTDNMYFNVGHDEINIKDNKGNVENNVNINVDEADENRCL